MTKCYTFFFFKCLSYVIVDTDQFGLGVDVSLAARMIRIQLACVILSVQFPKRVG